jgi:site-specific DNA recombinase
MANKSVRCAIYTRKSSEEGLEQSFNSLEAQREACSSYILSQKHEGWTALTAHYDDGGFSGGTMERPALKKLLDDIVAREIDTVVVYKVDRLTRSLIDFSKIIEVFDSHNVSFVSVTQQFNTTTSMGRLTLNVLLSFAQFEREVTGERIRDKVAASKKKGMWMGGFVPHGYDSVDRKLVVNENEACTVRNIFEQYVRLGCVSKLKSYLDRNGIRSKARINADGQSYGGKFYSRGALYHLLNNRIYVGEIVHHGKWHPGQHQAIVSQDLWNKVAARLTQNNNAHRAGKSLSTPSLLTGKLFDSNGVRFTPTHSLKDGKRYRYYTSQTVVRRTGVRPGVTRFPAHQLEEFVLCQIHFLLQSPDKCTTGMKGTPHKDAFAERARDLAGTWSALETSKQHEFARNILKCVTVGQTTVWIEIDRDKLLATLSPQNTEGTYALGTRKSEVIKLTGELKVLRRGCEFRVLSPDSDSNPHRMPVPSLVNTVARAHDWYEQIVIGKIHSIGQLAQQTGLTRRYVRRILQCATLSPKIVEAFQVGKQRRDLTVKQILTDIPLDWKMQEKRIFQTV